MASTLLAHGTVVQLSKSNAASKTTAGQWAVCILDKDSALPSLEGTFVVFSEKDEADIYLADYDDWLQHLDVANPSAAPSPDTFGGFITSLARKKADLHHLSSNWSEWCSSATTPPVDFLVGRHVQIPVKNGIYHTVVNALIASKDVANDSYLLTYDIDGTDGETTWQALALKSWCQRRPDALQKDKAPAGPSGAAPPPPALGYPLHVNPTMCPSAYGIIKKLTVSSNTSGNTLDARETLAVLAARHGDRSEYSKLVLTSPGTDADDVVGGPIDVIVDGLLALDRELGKTINPAQPLLWPSDSAKKLGEAFATALNRGIAPPSQHPFAALLKSKATNSGEWDNFLGDQWMITVDPSRHVFAQSKRQDTYIMGGMLEHFLRRSTSLPALAALDANQDSGSLLLVVSELAAPKSQPIPAPQNPVNIQNPFQFQPAHNQAQLSAFQLQLLQGHQSGVQVVLNDKKSADTSRDVLQLRSDAQALAHDPLASAELETLIKIKTGGDGKLLEDAVKAVTSPRLKRLLTSEGDDLTKLLQGALPHLAIHIDSIRCKLEERMQMAVMGG